MPFGADRRASLSFRLSMLLANEGPAEYGRLPRAGGLSG